MYTSVDTAFYCLFILGDFFTNNFCVYVCMLYIHGCMYMVKEEENIGLPLTYHPLFHFLESRILLNSELGSHLASPSLPGLAGHISGVTDTHMIMISLKCEFWEFELRFSCLYLKTLTH